MRFHCANGKCAVSAHLRGCAHWREDWLWSCSQSIY